MQLALLSEIILDTPGYSIVYSDSEQCPGAGILSATAPPPRSASLGRGGKRGKVPPPKVGVCPAAVYS